AVGCCQSRMTALVRMWWLGAGQSGQPDADGCGGARSAATLVRRTDHPTAVCDCGIHRAAHESRDRYRWVGHAAPGVPYQGEGEREQVVTRRDERPERHQRHRPRR
ncbi:MAG: hypothetical protein WCF33_14570, partial [Pseudonocardiaceae bacterium]